MSQICLSKNCVNKKTHLFAIMYAIRTFDEGNNPSLTVLP